MNKAFNEDMPVERVLELLSSVTNIDQPVTNMVVNFRPVLMLYARIIDGLLYYVNGQFNNMDKDIYNFINNNYKNILPICLRKILLKVYEENIDINKNILYKNIFKMYHLKKLNSIDEYITLLSTCTNDPNIIYELFNK